MFSNIVKGLLTASVASISLAAAGAASGKDMVALLLPENGNELALPDVERNVVKYPEGKSNTHDDLASMALKP